MDLDSSNSDTSPIRESGVTQDSSRGQDDEERVQQMQRQRCSLFTEMRSALDTCRPSLLAGAVEETTSPPSTSTGEETSTGSTKNVPGVAPTPFSRREAAEALYDALKACLAEWDAATQSEAGVDGTDNGQGDGRRAHSNTTYASTTDDEQFRSLVTETLSLLQTGLGPTDGQLRHFLLRLLPILRRNATRQLVLDCLVHTVPTPIRGSNGSAQAAVGFEYVYEVKQSNRGNADMDGDIGGEHDDPTANKKRINIAATDPAAEVMTALRDLLQSDPTALVPVVKCLTSLLPSLSNNHAAVVARICVEGLRAVEVDGLSLVVQCLLRSVRSVGDRENFVVFAKGEHTGEEREGEVNDRTKDDNSELLNIGAIEAVRAVREEWILVESDHPSRSFLQSIGSIHDGGLAPCNYDSGSSGDADDASDGGVNPAASSFEVVEILWHILSVSSSNRSEQSPSRNTLDNLSKGYLHILQCLVEESIVNANRDGDDDDDVTAATQEGGAAQPTSQSPSTSAFVTLDIVALLSLYSRPDMRNEVEVIINCMVRESIFPFDAVHGLLASFCTKGAAGEKSFESASPLMKQFSCCISNLCLNLLLGPLRCRRWLMSDKSACAGFMQRVEEITVRIITFLGEGKERDDMITSLIDLSFLGSAVYKGIDSRNTAKEKVGQKRRRNVRANDSITQGTNQVSASSLRLLLAFLKANDHRDHVLQYRRAITDRLVSDSTSGIAADPTSIHLLCQVVESLFLGSTTSQEEGRGGELIVLVHRLLFSMQESLQRHRADTDSGCQHVSQRIGLSLCRRLVRSHVVPKADRNQVWSWTVRILLSHSSGMTGGNPCVLPPELGLTGLLVLMNGCGIAPSGAVSTDANLAAPFPTSEVYGTIKTIVARMDVVQLDTKVSRIIQKSKSEHECFYTRVPSHFSPTNDAASKTRRMAFSIAPYIDSTFGSCALVSSSSAIHSVSGPNVVSIYRWCTTLFDVYLRLGREASGGRWCPDGWLTASLILQHCAVHDIARATASSQASSALRHVHGCIAAIGICTAVLKNAYELYSALVSTDDSEAIKKADRLFPLIQYQLLLVYDLRRRCTVVLSAISGESKSTTKKGKATINKEKEVSSSKAGRKRPFGIQPRARKKRKKKGRGGDRLIGNYDTSRRVRYLETLDALDDEDKNINTEKSALQPGEDDDAQDPKEDSSQGLSDTDALTSLLSLQAGSIHSFLCAQIRDKDFVPQTLLCDCLFNKRDSDMMNSFVASLMHDDEDEMGDASSSATEELERSVIHIICLRREVLRHIKHLAEQGRVELSATRLYSILATIENLSPALEALRKNHPGIDGRESCLSVSLSDASSEELAYVSVIQMRSLLSAYYDVLEASIKSIRCTLIADSSSTVLSQPIAETCLLHTRPVFEKLKVLLLQCEDAFLACRIVDLVSILCFKGSAGRGSTTPGAGAICKGSKLSWAVLHTVYAGHSSIASPDASDRLARPPPAFTYAVRKFTKDAAHKTDAASALAALDKYASLSTLQMKENAVLRYAFLSHWGLSSLFQASPCEDLRNLIESLRAYLENISEDIEGACRQTRQKKRPKKDTEKPRERNLGCLPTDIDIPGLTAKSFPVFFEGLLHTIVVFFSLAMPGNGAGYLHKDHDSHDSVSSSPYDQIQVFSRLFRDMAEIFASRFKLFPRRMLTTVVRASFLIVESCERQVLNCLTWRNAQPMFKHSDLKKGRIDYASSRFLQNLVDAMAYNCAGSAILFCDLVKSQAKKKQSHMEDAGCDDDGDYEPSIDVVGIEGENWAYASSHKSIANLLLRGEKLLDSLRAICSSYNLCPPRVRITKSEKVAGSERDARANLRASTRTPAKTSARVNELPASSLRRKVGANDSAVADVAASPCSSKKKKQRVTPEPISIESNAASPGNKATGTHRSEIIRATAHEDDGITTLNHDAKNEKDGKDGAATDPEESPKTEDSESDSDSDSETDSFGADGAWGADNDETSDRAGGGASLALNFVT